MRVLASILASAIVAVSVFGLLWSSFVVRHHSYGGDSRSSQIGGTLMFFGVYLFPALLAAALALVGTTEHALFAKKKVRAVAGWRWLAWTVAVLVALAGVVSIANPTLSVAAILCGFAAAVVSGFTYERIVHNSPKNERG